MLRPRNDVEKLLKTYNEIRCQIKEIIEKNDSDPVYADKYLEAKTKFCNNKIITNFHAKAPNKESSAFVCQQ